MTEAKFTKGEWFIEKGANWNDDCWAISVKRDYDDSVHHCFAEVTYKMEHEECNPELEANAHLIAAAPEMYHAISEIYETLNRFDSESLDFIELHVGSLENILAKARGEL